MKRLAIILFAMLPLALAAKPGYRFTLQIDGNTDSTMLLCCYYAQEMHVMDTARNNGQGKFVFSGSRELHPGLYFFTNNAGRSVEFVIYHEKPDFKFHTDNRAWTMSMSVKGSKQNEIFYNYERASESLYHELEEQKGGLDSAAYADLARRQHLRVDSLKLDLIAKHPEAMISKMLAATKRIDDEVPTTAPDGTPLTYPERYNYFIAHYFDYLPLDDDFIVRTPKQVFYQRVMEYTDKYTHGLSPERLCPLLDSLIDRAEPAPEVYKWLINTLAEKYLQSKIMVYDEVYVHLVQRYFATGKATWLAPSTVDMNVERATKWDRLLVGREAPELILYDTLRRAHSLHHMPGDYTLLLFWSPTCGHCRDIIPAVYTAFNELADSLDMTAFAILTEPDETTVGKWKKFLAEHHMTNPRWVNMSGGEANVDWREVYDITTTPQIYLVENKEHKFIAKKLNAGLLREICKQLKKQQ